MAATDQPYRNQRTLDVVFGVSCGLLLFSTIWMFVQDFNRDFKTVQRKFRDVEATLAEREMIDKLPDPTTVNEKRLVLRQARRALEKARAEVADKQRDLQARRDQADERYRGIKADYDSQVSYYIIAADEASEVPSDTARYKAMKKHADAIKAGVDRLEAQLTQAKNNFDKVDLQIKEEVTSVTGPHEKAYTDAEEEMKKLTGVFDRFAKQAVAKSWGPGDTFRALPILDGFESPTKIRQLWLPELTIEYGSFKEVPRFDRCTTCHLGIDRAVYDRQTLVKMGDEEENRRLLGKLEDAQKMIQQRIDSGENLGITPEDLPGESSGSVGLIAMLGILSALVAALSLGILTGSSRVGMQWLAGGLVLTGLTAAAMAAFAPRIPAVKTIKLNAGEVTQYAAHPRLDLFVDANSPHSSEKFGCTICHSGQGSATDFNLAAHTPNDSGQEHVWHKGHGWQSSHFWDFPMLSRRFVESSCVKCHHQMTDLIRHGSREEAPKLLKGYNLVKEMGCFGCHEIHGLKGTRSVGPDIRLEPTPALDYLSAAEQERAKSDPANPPGTMRKVGPSLRRLAEKTDEEWTRKWVLDPRGFRADTRMPHFYNLSTNNKDALPEDQKAFPDTEIHAITHYLLTESKAYLGAKDTYRDALLTGKSNLGELQAQLVKAGLSDRDLKEVYDVSRKFADLALLSSPMQARVINSNALRQRQLQERIAELHRKAASAGEADAKTVKTEIDAAGQELQAVTTALIDAAKPAPLAAHLVGEDGSAIQMPVQPGDAGNGRRLFTEKGCLACHAHEGTRKDETVGKTTNFAVHSDANFAPELSRIVAKLRPSVPGVDPRRWLVQWLLNPNVYHPRTRMPITHLSPAEANDVATWLLAQKVSDWNGKDADPPDVKGLVALARVYLLKAPGMTRADVDAFLPEGGDQLPGIPKDRLEPMARDAEERKLAAGAVTPDSLKWYIGKKSIGRLACYGCHDIPGFETAKPIGTGLNDWGKKDVERLAFEDGEVFVQKHFNIVPTRTTRKQVEDRIAALKAKEKEGLSRREQRELTDLEKQVANQEEIQALEKKALDKGLTSAEQRDLEKLRPQKFFEAVLGHAPFEEIFAEALGHGHRTREGFLHLKLMEPRSYDYNRRLKWDDRLRMPQFKFARTRQRPGESDEAYKARAEVEEAEAREAVMTFILGLVAEPIPARYVNQPKNERHAEVIGRQVLDKYNCAGCHQVRPGVYDFRLSDQLTALLQRSFNTVQGSEAALDHIYRSHNAWAGVSPTSDRLMAFGYRDGFQTERNDADEESPFRGTDAIRLVDALRFPGPDRVMRDLPAGSYIYLPRGQYDVAPAFGGTWTDLMVAYMMRKNPTVFPKDKPDDARSALPPPLVRQGERVQPDWMYRFLLNPTVIRPQNWVLLRMPKFNMSPEEARALVNYFAAVARTTNPGAGVTFPYVQIEQREGDYWKDLARDYDRLPDRQKARIKELEDQLAKLDAKKGAARADDLKRQLQSAEAHLKVIEALFARPDPARKDAQVKDLYSRNAFGLLQDKNLCLQCHNFGAIRTTDPPKGPDLTLTAERLRPEWVEQWIANPKRMFPYQPLMPQNFPNEPPDPAQWKFQNVFAGSPREQVRAVRDILMDPNRLADLIIHRPPPPPETKPPDKK